MTSLGGRATPGGLRHRRRVLHWRSLAVVGAFTAGFLASGLAVARFASSEPQVPIDLLAAPQLEEDRIPPGRLGGGLSAIDRGSTRRLATANGFAYYVATDSVGETCLIAMSLETDVTSARCTPDLYSQAVTLGVAIQGAATQVSLVPDGTVVAAARDYGLDVLTPNLLLTPAGTEASELELRRDPSGETVRLWVLETPDLTPLTGP